MKDKLIKAWKYFEGKKRNIGIIAGFILKSIVVIKPTLIPNDYVSLIDTGIDLFLIGGVLDSVRRTDKGTKIINKSIDKANKTIDNILVKIKN